MINFRLALAHRAALVAAALWSADAAADPPHATARTFQDWALDCRLGPCAIRGVLRAADASALVTLEARGRAAAARLVLVTPLPLLLPDGVILALGADPLRPLAWRTCGPTGCAAEAPLDAGLLAALKRERRAEVTLTLDDGARVRLPVSLIGFTAAWEAMAAAP